MRCLEHMWIESLWKCVWEELSTLQKHMLTNPALPPVGDCPCHEWLDAHKLLMHECNSKLLTTPSIEL
jgi:hypothetical protein